MKLLLLVRRSAAQARLVLVGGLVVTFLFQLLLIAHAAEIERSQGFGRLAELVPAFLQRGLGSQALLLATFKGSVAFGYFHPVVLCLVSLIALYLATEPAHEIESGLVDLVLARPVQRRQLLTRSLLLSLATAVTITAVMMSGTYLGLVWMADGLAWPSFRLLLLLAAHLVAVAWCCAAIGLCLAASTRRWNTAFTLGSMVIVVGYLVDFLAIGWPPARYVSWLFPFDYYPALLIVGGTANSATDLTVLLTATAVFIALAYRRFDARDL